MPPRSLASLRYGQFVLLATALMANPAQALEVEDIRRVSVSSDGTEGNDRVSHPDTAPGISANGLYVAFNSESDNLVANDTNGSYDVFVHNLQTGETLRASIASDGSESEPIDYDPRDVFVSNFGDVVFSSLASNLVPGDTNNDRDVFVHSLATGQTQRVSVTSNGWELSSRAVAGDVTPDGRNIVFASDASEPIEGEDVSPWDIFLHDRVSGETSIVSVDLEGRQSPGSDSLSPEITADGRYVTFVTTVNGINDAYVKDRSTGDLWLVSLTHDGKFHNATEFGVGAPSISDDGRFVVFASWATNLVPNDTNGQTDIFQHDRAKGETTRLIEAAHRPKISGDGRFVAAESELCVPQQIVLLDRLTGATIRVSVSPDGRLGDGESAGLKFSRDGRLLAFGSVASNLVSEDTNGVVDTFVAVIGDGNGPRGSYIDPTDTDADGLEDDCDPDDDGDLMPDAYEVHYGLDPLDAGDANQDLDGDGLTNREEFDSRTDPTVTDTDGDGVVDGEDAYPQDPSRWTESPPPGGGNPPPPGNPPPDGSTTSGGGGAMTVPCLLLWLAIVLRRRKAVLIAARRLKGQRGLSANDCIPD